MSKRHSHPISTETSAQIRLDSWVWSARLYKSRKDAQTAIKAGHVKVNGNKGKPAKTVTMGDIIDARRGYEQFQVEVIGLTDKRVSASLVEQLYRETPSGLQQRAQQEEIRQQARQGVKHDHHKPSQRDRKAMIKLKQRNS